MGCCEENKCPAGSRADQARVGTGAKLLAFSEGTPLSLEREHIAAFSKNEAPAPGNHYKYPPVRQAPPVCPLYRWGNRGIEVIEFVMAELASDPAGLAPSPGPCTSPLLPQGSRPLLPLGGPQCCGAAQGLLRRAGSSQSHLPAGSGLSSAALPPRQAGKGGSGCSECARYGAGPEPQPVWSDLVHWAEPDFLEGPRLQGWAVSRGTGVPAAAMTVGRSPRH